MRVDLIHQINYKRNYCRLLLLSGKNAVAKNRNNLPKTNLSPLSLPACPTITPVCCCAFTPRKLEKFGRCHPEGAVLHHDDKDITSHPMSTGNSKLSQINLILPLMYQKNAAKKRAALTRTPQRGDRVGENQPLNTPKKRS